MHIGQRRIQIQEQVPINDPRQLFNQRMQDSQIEIEIIIKRKSTKRETFLCLALSSLETLALLFMVEEAFRRPTKNESEREERRRSKVNLVFSRSFLSLSVNLLPSPTKTTLLVSDY